MLNALFRFLSLRPYGNALLSEAGRLWLAVAAFMVIVMATVEAMAWGYMGSAFSESHGLWVGVVIGVMVWLVVFGIDYTLMTFDTARDDYEERLRLKSPDDEIPSRPQPHRLTRSAPYLFRIGFAVFSMILTAPYLSQLVFSTDITTQIRQDREAAVASARTAIESRHGAVMLPLTQRLEQLNAQLTEEVAGAGGSRSGKYGAGPVARSIQEHIAQVRAQVTQAGAARKEELQGFDHAVASGDNALLGKRWHVALPGDTPREREQQMERIRATPAYDEIKFRIYGGMALLMCALLMLKLLPGSGLALYFCERMQQEWQRYRNGCFDAWLDEADRSTSPHPIPPSRFEYLMLNGYVRELWNAEERRQRLDRLRLRQLEEEEEALRREKLAAEQRAREAARLARRQETEEALARIGHLEEQMRLALAARQDVQDAIARKEAEMAALRAAREVGPDNITTLNQRLAQLLQQLDEAETLLAQAREGNQSSDIKRMELLSELTEGYLRLKEHKDVTQSALNQARADYANFARKLDILEEEHRLLNGQLSGIRDQMRHLQDCQQQLVRQMATEAMALGLGEPGQAASESPARPN